MIVDFIPHKDFNLPPEILNSEMLKINSMVSSK